MPPSYSGLSRAQLSYDYLHSNSTTHEFLFGALAEILDNSRDADAKKMEIYTINDRSLRGGLMLCFLDDGEGMDPPETANVITFGLSQKKTTDSKQIGQYGNGLKSASMRIANDMILFTKKGDILTCLMLSRTFHEEEKITEVIVPLPSFDAHSLSPLYGKNKSEENHEIEMNLILKYSPFHTRGEFFEQFRRISAKSGTLVILYNLKLLDIGVTELDFKTNPQDILIAETDLSRDKILVAEKYSFRAYTALLYSEPRMKVYIQSKKVHAHRLVYDLYKPRCYHYTSARFKARSKEVANKAEKDYRLAKDKLKDAEGRSREFEKANLPTTMSSEDRVKMRTLQTAAADLRVEMRRKEIVSVAQQRSLKEPKTLAFIFGINLENRKNDGLFVYNCNRLIKMYVRVGPQLEGGQKCRGVVGIVDIPYLVLEPTHNKQDFTDAKEYRHLLKVLGEHMEQYWNDVDLGSRSVTDFWEFYGYRTSGWEEMASVDSQYVNRRGREKKIWLQCDDCLNWRVLPFSSRNVGKVFPDDWVCSKNPDSSRNKCNRNEEKLNLPEGKFQKVEKSREEKDAEALKKVAESILKEKEKEKAQLDVVLSSKLAKSKMEEVARRKVAPMGARVLPVDELEDSEEELLEELNNLTQSSGEPSNKRSMPSEEPLSIKRKRINSSRYQTDETLNVDVVHNFVSTHVPRKSGVRSLADQTAGDGSNGVESNVAQIDEWWPELSDDELEVEGRIEVGSRVEVKVRNKWHIGTALKKSGPDFIVRLDKLPSSTYDKRIPPNSDKIRLAAVQQSPTVEQNVTSGLTVRTNNDELLEKICENFRCCLGAIVPPEWQMSQQQIENLTQDELANFPVNDFLTSYRLALTKLLQAELNKALADRSN